MWYEYRCDGCGNIHESQRFNRVGCPHDEFVCCVGAELVRIFSTSVQSPRAQEAYYNHAVGEYVTSDQHYKQILKRKSEEHGERLGTDISLQPVYPADMKRDADKLGVGAGDDKGESVEHARRNNPDAFRPSTSKVIDVGA